MNNHFIPSGASAGLRLLGLGIVLVLTTSLIATTAQAVEYGPDDEAETLEAMRPKEEKEAVLPAFPLAANLLPVDTGPTARQSFAIDTKAVSIEEGNVVRYTVVSTSSSGAKNISFEGLNCLSSQFKRYAYGSKDGKWVRSRENAWHPVSSLSPNQLHYTLRQFFFCSGGAVAGTTTDIINRIRDNRPLMN